MDVQVLSLLTVYHCVHYTCVSIRPRRSHSIAAYSRQTFPWTICQSVCPVHCGKTADLIRMPLGIIGRTGPGMRQVVGFGDRSTGRDTFGVRHCPKGPIGHTCATAPQCGPLPKLLWADLLQFPSMIWCCQLAVQLYQMFRAHFC